MIQEWMDAWVGGWVDGCMAESMDRWMDGCIMDTGQTDALADKQTDGQVELLAVDMLVCDKANLGDQVQDAVQVTSSTWS